MTKAEQKFSSTFTGEEFFLKDHILHDQKVLPGVASLEMAREAAKEMLGDSDLNIIFKNIIWISPMIVKEPKTFYVSLFLEGNDTISYKIYSEINDDKIIHVQGIVIVVPKIQRLRPHLNIESLKSHHRKNKIDPSKFYDEEFSALGLMLGDAYRGIKEIHLGEDSTFIQLSLSTALVDTISDFVLHPSLMDPALQASRILVFEEGTDRQKLVVPFSIDSLEIFGPCAPKMWSYIRKVNTIGKKGKKFDIDICDTAGNICIRIKGFTVREWNLNQGESTQISTVKWKKKEVNKESNLEQIQLHVIRYDENEDGFEERAVDLFNHIKEVIGSKPKEEHLFQIITKDPLDFGLAGALKTAHLENPKIHGQVICLSNTERPIEEILKENQHDLEDIEIWYEENIRKVKELEQIKESSEEKGSPYKDNGLYLITGGAGGLGFIFAKDILEKTNSSTIVLTGRSDLDVSKLEKLKKLEELTQKRGSKLEYIKADITDENCVQGLVDQIRSSYGNLNGIIHSAGIIKDNFIFKKNQEEFKAVLAPKVRGTINLDEATKNIELDFFVLFSSLAGITGNLGQIDYATGNAFMDAFASKRNKAVSNKERYGHTISINWPLWKEGGMKVDNADQERIKNTFNIIPLETNIGLEKFTQGFVTKKSQLIIIEKGGKAVLDHNRYNDDEKVSLNENELLKKIEELLAAEIASLLKLKIQDLNLSIEISRYGFDSIILVDFVNKLREKYNVDLIPTIFFEYPTIRKLASYLSENKKEQLLSFLSKPVYSKDDIEAKYVNENENRPYPSTIKEISNVDPVAIIGIAGQFPKSEDIDAFWNNLESGKDCISEIPASRWNWKEYWGDPTLDQNKTNIKWGGFIEDTDQFDPLFFGVSPREALLMDPQQRLLMTYSWLVIEDAGYSIKSLSGTNTGIFIGTGNSGYSDLIKKIKIPIEGYTSTGMVPSIGPNRVSYFFDIHGPSEPIETACSSSLVAIHRAVSSIQKGECSQAIVGGINTIVTPDMHISFSKAGMLSVDGKCKTFSKNANGYVRGEGVGMLFLKRLKDAEADGDYIYGIIRGSAENHGGRASSLTAPNPKAQTELIKTAYINAGVDPRTVTYIEAHGTGTPLGDPVEINGLKAAFKDLYESIETDKIGIADPHCGVGSVKTNIGHLELAAGVAGVIKILLQLKHKKLVKNLHHGEQNPYIDLKGSPFYLVQKNQDWPVLYDRKDQPLPRRAGISSFSFGGSNAHLIIEEYVKSADASQQEIIKNIDSFHPVLILLSAKNDERLKKYAERLKLFFEKNKEINLREIAYTLQTGRDAMEARMGLVATSHKDLLDKLNKYLQGEEVGDIYVGENAKNQEGVRALNSDHDFLETINQWILNKEYQKLLKFWVQGLDIDWSKLYGEDRPRRVPLPTYPFARERYWIGDKTAGSACEKQRILHPLVHENTSTLSKQRFSTTLTGDEFFLKDHVVNGQKILPGVAYLEMAREAVRLSLGKEEEEISLQDVVWITPIVIEDNQKKIDISIFTEENGKISYEIYTEESGETTIHSQGKAIIETIKEEESAVDIEGLKASCQQGELSGEECYKVFEEVGVKYGPSHKGIEKIYLGEGIALAKIHLPESISDTIQDYKLHPSLMDSAFQSALAAILHQSEKNKNDLREILVPFSLDSLEVKLSCTSSMWVFVHFLTKESNAIQNLTFDLYDQEGKDYIKLRGFSSIGLNKSSSEEVSFEKKDDSSSPQISSESNEVSDDRALIVKLLEHLKKELSTVIRLPIQKIDNKEQLEKYGIDSIMIPKLTNELEKTFGSLPKTLFFEYRTIHDLGHYFIEFHRSKVINLLDLKENAIQSISHKKTTAKTAQNDFLKRERFLATSRNLHSKEDIAIVGLSGKYPQSPDIRTFWNNLRDGRDCITEIPSNRWDWKRYYNEQNIENSVHHSKWGGFIEGVDEFDPLFFNISPLEAISMDPQERLFLEHSWMALEDAGIDRLSLEKNFSNKGGVYVGVMWSEYQLLRAEASFIGSEPASINTFASIANRVSYFLNLHGPSFGIDTMCSGSLTSIYLACEDLKNRRIDIAIAGGVNVSVHPNKYLALSRNQFMSRNGHCCSFGENGDGFIPGEGVGVIILKRLSDALTDGDHIYGVIKGSAINHGGKTNGYSVPNPNAQQMVINRVLEESNINPRSISYIEAHGTGTQLGDPIEIAGLTKAFQRETRETGYCSIGSVKSNIGHCESAAGIAGVTKVLLQLEHKKIVPSLHAEVLNPNIDFEKTPFVVNRELKEWKRPIVDGKEYPRRAGISSFGAGGSNAHLIIEEYVKEESTPVLEVNESNPVLIILSARNEERLKEYAQKLLNFIKEEEQTGTLNLRNIAYTLQVGREAMEERLGFLATSTEEIKEQLLKYIQEEKGNFHHENVSKNKEIFSDNEEDLGFQSAIKIWLEQRNYEQLLKFWVQGLDIDWSKLYREEKLRRVPLPTYPFAREQYWIEEGKAGVTHGKQHILHPLVHENTSTLSKQRFSTTLTGDEFFLKDHVVNGQKILPGVAYLEMAREAVRLSLGKEGEEISLQDVVWITPIAIEDKPKKVDISIFAEENRKIAYEIYTEESGKITIHSQGKAIVGTVKEEENIIDLEDLKASCQQGELSGEECYKLFEEVGVNYGPSHRGIEKIYRRDGIALAKIHLPELISDTIQDYKLHPSLMDMALQGVVGVIIDKERSLENAMMPFALDSLEVFSDLSQDAWAVIKTSKEESNGSIKKIDLFVCDEKGKINLSLKNLSLKKIAFNKQHTLSSTLFNLAPIWDSIGSNIQIALPSVRSNIVIIGGDAAQRVQLQQNYPTAQYVDISPEASVEEIVNTIGSNQIDHLIFIALNPSFESVIDSHLMENQTKGVFFAFKIFKALIKLGYDIKELGITAITFNTQQIGVNDSIDPTHAGLHGLVGSLAKEYKNWKVTLLDLDIDSEIPPVLSLALSEDLHGITLAYRHGEWFKQSLSTVVYPPSLGDKESVYKHGGVYVIIGGAGGIGEVLTKWLIDYYKAHVVWIGRREKEAIIQAKIDSFGTIKPDYIQADATSFESLHMAYEKIKAKHHKINGIVHSAIVLSDATIATMTEEQFRRSFSAKADVCVQIGNVFGKENLDFLLFFSSMQSFIRAAGQSNYAAGCVFKDAFAKALSKELSAKVKIMNWGYWGNVGVVANDYYQKLMEDAGIGSIEPEEGMESIELLMKSPFHQIGLIKSISANFPLKNLVTRTNISFSSKAVSSVFDKVIKSFPYENISSEVKQETIW